MDDTEYVVVSTEEDATEKNGSTEKKLVSTEEEVTTRSSLHCS